MQIAGCCLCRRDENSRLTKGGNQRQGKSIQDSSRWTKCGYWIFSLAFVIADAKYSWEGFGFNEDHLQANTNQLHWFLFTGKGWERSLWPGGAGGHSQGGKGGKKFFLDFFYNLTSAPAAGYSCDPGAWGEAVLRLHDSCYWQKHSSCQVGLSSNQLSFSDLHQHLDLISSQLNTISTKYHPLTSQCCLLCGPLSLQEQDEFLRPRPQKVPNIYSLVSSNAANAKCTTLIFIWSLISCILKTTTNAGRVQKTPLVVGLRWTWEILCSICWIRSTSFVV